VLQALRDGLFLEAALIHNQQVSGTSVRELKIALETNKTALAEIEIVGAGKVHVAKPDTIIIFNVPPSFDVWMHRLNKRTVLPEEEVRRRLETALVEYEAALTHDYYRIVINNDVMATTRKIDAIARQDAHDPSEEYAGRELVKGLHQQTQDWLSKKH
jgi:guanylate kinase